MKKEKQSCTLPIDSEKEQFINRIIKAVKKKTGMSKKRIATELIFAGVKAKKLNA